MDLFGGPDCLVALLLLCSHKGGEFGPIAGSLRLKGAVGRGFGSLDPNPRPTAPFNLKEPAIGPNSPPLCEHRRRRATKQSGPPNKSISKTIPPSPRPIRHHLSPSPFSPRAALDQ